MAGPSWHYETIDRYDGARSYSSAALWIATVAVIGPAVSIHFMMLSGAILLIPGNFPVFIGINRRLPIRRGLR